jgi:hypothetical protein
MRAVHAAGETRTALIAVVAVVWAGAGCVDKSRDPTPPSGSAGGAGTATCELTPLAPLGDPTTIPSADTAAPGPYAWKNVTIKGGGFVSGIVMSSALPGLMFARTDVGGAYRYSPATKRWLPITDSIGHADGNLTGVESIAADPVDPNRVYVAAGQYVTAGNGFILASTDMGQTFTRYPIPAPMGGNVDGRSMGERLAVDPNLPSVLYFGSRNAGLYRSTDSGQTWSLVTTLSASGASGYGLTFVVFDPASGTAGSPTPAIYVGVGVTNDVGLYRSTDAGATWEAVAGQPSALMPHHAVLDRCGNLFLAYNDGPGPNNIKNGAIWRYATTTGDWTDVSPPHRGGGYGGLAADATHPGTLLVTTIDLWAPDDIYRTRDGGAHWTAIGGAAQRDVNGATWLYFHGNTLSATGWAGDVEIDPFDPDHALHITGQGIWSTNDVTAADAGMPTHWRFDDDGLEETVALDLASPPAGSALLTAVGDIAGFRHDDLDVSPPDGMFGPPLFGNTTSLDFAEASPNIVARVGTASGSSTSRGAYSTDGGATWKAFTNPAGSTGSGSVAVTADGQTFVWAPKGAAPSYSRDNGATWTACAGLATGVQVGADRVNPMKLYAGSRSRMYVSTDGGATFTQAAYATGTTAAGGRPRPVFGVEGDVWVATGSGLYRSQDSGATYAAVPPLAMPAAVGFGMAVDGATYPAVYASGSVGGTWGVYRSTDGGLNWNRIDDPQHQFGYVSYVAGDQRQAGRVYLGTGGRGILYGDPR